MQRAGIDSQAESFALVAIPMMKLFGEKIGAELSGRFLDNQNLPETRRGLIAGGNDSLAWLEKPDQPPFGWVHYCSK